MPAQAAILAGGKGTRMSEYSATPKVLLPLGDKPILAHQLERLREAGFSTAFLCLGDRADEVQAELGDGSRFGIDIEYRVEQQPRGTAGAVKEIEAAIESSLLVLYGDLYIGLDLQKLIRFHESHDGVATVVVRQTDHPEDSDLVEVDADHCITAIGRIADGRVSGTLGCAAICVIRRELLERVPEEGVVDFARDVFPVAVQAGDKLVAYETTERVMDVGTPHRYEKFLKSWSGS